MCITLEYQVHFRFLDLQPLAMAEPKLCCSYQGVLLLTLSLEGTTGARVECHTMRHEAITSA